MNTTAASNIVPADGEWLLTDGAGGFAMGRTDGGTSRRYHAQLIASLDPPLQRTVLLRRTMDWFEPGAGGEPIWCSSADFVGDDGLVRRHPPVGSPAAPLDRQPATRSRGPLGEAVITEAWTGPVWSAARSITVLGPGVVHLRWDLSAGQRGPGMRGVWCVRPFTPLVGFHALTRSTDQPPSVQRPEDGRLVVSRPGVVDVGLIPGGAGVFDGEVQWWRGFALDIERDRGLDWVVDDWSPGVMRTPVDLPPGGTMSADVVVRQLTPAPPPPLPESTRPRRQRRPADAFTRSLARLERAGEDYVVRRGDGRTVIAGYPWFADWGRDTMIALPGLLPPGRRDAEATAALAAIVAHRRDGLLPNCFHDADGADDHTADAGPWFLRTLARYAANAAARPMLESAGLFDAALEIVRCLRAGTRHGIGVGDDGLMHAGENSGPPLTWMDAHRDGVVFTPRRGQPVEINALWIEGLAGLAEHHPDPAARAEVAAVRDAAQAAFRPAFWWPERGCLVDRRAPVPGGQFTPVHELRPNQVIAAACPSVPLSGADRAGIVAACRGPLLTPVGLRTLGPNEPGWIGRYRGDLNARDAAYHQGTVWPWLLGSWVDAQLLACDDDASRQRAAATARADLQGILDSLDDGCTGQLAEIFEGDAPHRPDGCPAQAWSVAEVMRAMRAIVDVESAASADAASQA